MDDGVTASGISCQMNNGGSYNSLGTSLPNSSDLGNLLDQFYRTYYSPNALQFFGVPDGTYNLTCYAGNGVSSQGANNYGSTFVVHDSVNGDQTGSTAEASHTTDALTGNGQLRHLHHRPCLWRNAQCGCVRECGHGWQCHH